MINCDFASKETRQAEKAAKFWNVYYKPNDRVFSTSVDDLGNANSISTSNNAKCHEWICHPDVIMPLLPLQTPTGEMCQVLEIGCGDSTLLETIYDCNPTQINMLGVDISEEVIALMQEKHKDKNVAHLLRGRGEIVSRLHFEVANILNLSAELCPPNSYNLIIDKGTSDTMQYRAPKDDCKILLTHLFTTIYKLLVVGGTYIIISPKYSIKCLRTTVPWDVQRLPLALQRSDIMLDNPSNKEAVYAHVCTKHREEGVAEAAAPKEWLVCPVCEKSRESLKLKGEKWRIHRKFCKMIR
jgi:hypothetical protein